MADLIAVQSNLTWTTDGNNEPQGGLILYKDDNNYAIVGGRSLAGGEFRITIVSGGVSSYDDDTLSVTKNKNVKIQYDFDTTELSFFYWNGSAWTQLGTTQTVNLGSPLFAVLSSNDSTTGNGANPYIFDNFYMYRGAYATLVPDEPVMSDDFTGATIDTAKWDETDPNTRISQNDVLNIANPHSSNIALFADKLQSDLTFVAAPALGDAGYSMFM